eukprot:12934600-Prorocentrum_lima.AAC.1
MGSVSRVGGRTIAVQSPATVPIGITELGNATYKGSVLDNSAFPAPLALRNSQRVHGIGDTRRKQRDML